MKKTRTKLSKYLRDKRVTSEITLRQMSKVTGLSQGYLSDLEHSVEGQNPSLETLRALTRGYEVSPGVFFQ